MSSQHRPFSTATAISDMAELLDQDELRDLPCDQIDADPNQPRKTWDTADAIAEYESTRESIRATGVRNPVTVRPGRAGRWVLISGETRLRSCVEIGLPTIPAIVRQRIDDLQVGIDQLVENVRRNDLNPVDLAVSLQTRIDAGMGRDELSKALGMTEQWMSKKLSILKLSPEVRELARRGAVKDIDTLSALDKLPPAEREKYLSEIETGQVDGSAIRKAARAKKKKAKGRVDANIRALANRMSEQFGARVTIEHNPKSNKGKVSFTFFSLEELDGLLEKWNFTKDA